MICFYNSVCQHKSYLTVVHIVYLWDNHAKTDLKRTHNNKYTGGFMMKYLLHSTFIVFLLIFAGCANNGEKDDVISENTEEQDTADTESAHEEDTEEHEEGAENDDVLAKSVGSIEDFDYVTIDQYNGEGERFETDNMMERSVFLNEDHFFVHTEDQEVISYTKELKENWKVELPYSIDQEMVLTEDFLLVNVVTYQGDEGYIEALDRETGDSVYQIDLTDYNDLSPVLVVDDMIYFFAGESTDPDERISSDTFTFHKYDLKDGSLEWEQEVDNVESRLQFDRIPYADDTIYILDDDEDLLALDMNTGDEVWKQEIPMRLGHFRPYIVDDTIYLFDLLENTFHGYNRQTGEEILDYHYPGLVDTTYVKPAFKDAILFYHDLKMSPDDEDEIEGFRLIATDLAKKELLWSLDFEENYIFNTQIIDDTLYVSAANMDEELDEPSKLLKLDAETGEMIAAIELDERMDEALSSNYLYSGASVTDDTFAFFYEHVAYYIK